MDVDLFRAGGYEAGVADFTVTIAPRQKQSYDIEQTAVDIPIDDDFIAASTYRNDGFFGVTYGADGLTNSDAGTIAARPCEWIGAGDTLSVEIDGISSAEKTTAYYMASNFAAGRALVRVKYRYIAKVQPMLTSRLELCCDRDEAGTTRSPSTTALAFYVRGSRFGYASAEIKMISEQVSFIIPSWMTKLTIRGDNLEAKIVGKSSTVTVPKVSVIYDGQDNAYTQLGPIPIVGDVQSHLNRYDRSQFGAAGANFDIVWQSSEYVAELKRAIGIMTVPVLEPLVGSGTMRVIAHPETWCYAGSLDNVSLTIPMLFKLASFIMTISALL
jgi:hypothetical protein